MMSAWGPSWGPAWGSSWGYAEQSARSGYWRLFFYNMQEEALNAEKEKTTEKVDAGGAVAKKSVAKKEAPRKRTRIPKAENSLRAAEPQEEKIPAFRLAPAVTGPSVYEQVQQLIALGPVPYTKARHNNRERITKQRKQRARRRAAAFLLLAA